VAIGVLAPDREEVPERDRLLFVLGREAPGTGGVAQVAAGRDFRHFRRPFQAAAVIHLGLPDRLARDRAGLERQRVVGQGREEGRAGPASTGIGGKRLVRRDQIVEIAGQRRTGADEQRGEDAAP